MRRRQSKQWKPKNAIHFVQLPGIFGMQQQLPLFTHIAFLIFFQIRCTPKMKIKIGRSQNAHAMPQTDGLYNKKTRATAQQTNVEAKENPEKIRMRQQWGLRARQLFFDGFVSVVFGKHYNRYLMHESLTSYMNEQYPLHTNDKWQTKATIPCTFSAYPEIYGLSRWKYSRLLFVIVTRQNFRSSRWTSAHTTDDDRLEANNNYRCAPVQLTDWLTGWLGIYLDVCAQTVSVFGILAICCQQK